MQRNEIDKNFFFKVLIFGEREKVPGLLERIQTDGNIEKQHVYPVNFVERKFDNETYHFHNLSDQEGNTLLRCFMKTTDALVYVGSDRNDNNDKKNYQVLAQNNNWEFLVYNPQTMIPEDFLLQLRIKTNNNLQKKMFDVIKPIMIGRGRRESLFSVLPKEVTHLIAEKYMKTEFVLFKSAEIHKYPKNNDKGCLNGIIKTCVLI